MTPELIAEIKQMDEFSNQARFLARYNINTDQDLLEFEKLAYEKVNPLKSKRENLWKKNKRVKTDEEKQIIENEIVEISKKITPITEEIKLCNNIKQRVNKIKQVQLYEQIEQEKVQFEKEQEKNKKDRNKAR
ncbi:MAG: hypothetical protein HFJ35_00340 [Clostridia bacterium]|nr:hypothetical protein [Clostridia bacterium]